MAVPRRLVVVVVAAGALVSACQGACQAEVRPPPRPLLVPKTAAWAGGADGGAWIDCWRASDVEQSKDPTHAPHSELDDRFDCAVYADQGAIEQRGRFRLLDVDDAGGLHPARDPRGRPMQFSAWDGCAIHLVGRMLSLEKHTRCDGLVCSAGPC